MGGAGTFRCSQWPQRSWHYRGSTRRTDTQTRYIKLDRCSSQIANVNQERPVLVPGTCTSLCIDAMRLHTTMMPILCVGDECNDRALMLCRYCPDDMTMRMDSVFARILQVHQSMLRSGRHVLRSPEQMSRCAQSISSATVMGMWADSKPMTHLPELSATAFWMSEEATRAMATMGPACVPERHSPSPWPLLRW